MIYGYARVSTDGQSVDAQVKQLRAAGAEKIFEETDGKITLQRSDAPHYTSRIRAAIHIVAKKYKLRTPNPTFSN
jgi:Resolvase, N terminal domain